MADETDIKEPYERGMWWCCPACGAKWLHRQQAKYCCQIPPAPAEGYADLIADAEAKT